MKQDVVNNDIKIRAYGLSMYKNCISEGYKEIEYRFDLLELQYKVKHNVEVWGFTHKEIKEVLDNVFEELNISEKAGYSEVYEGITCYYLDNEKVDYILSNKTLILTKTIYLDMISHNQDADIDYKIVEK